MTIIEKIFLISAIGVIFFPFVVFATAMIMDAIYSYFDDKWVEENQRR